MNSILIFTFGFIAGTFAGIFITALLKASKTNE